MLNPKKFKNTSFHLTTEYPIHLTTECPILITLEYPILVTLEHPILVTLEHPILITLEHPILITLEHPVLITLEHPVLITLEHPIHLFNKPNYGWLPLDDKRFNSILLDIQSKGLKVWDKDFNRYLHSTKVNLYDPIQDYLYGLEKKWDGNDHIGRLAECVPTNCPHWKNWFRKWFLSIVAQWIGKDRRYGNSVAPLLINLDEFKAIPPRIQQGFLKNVMQLLIWLNPLQ